MKLFSAAGIDDLLNPATYAGWAAGAPVKRLGYLDLFHCGGGTNYQPTPSPGKGMVLPVYISVLSISLRDIQVDNPDGSDFIMFGVIIQGDSNATTHYNGPQMGLGRADSWSAVNAIGLGRNEIINTFGGGKPVCVEMSYQMSTGLAKQYINGVLRWSGTVAQVAGQSSYRTLLLNPYQANDNGRSIILSDYYLGTTKDPDFRLGNFKIAKLVVKSTTLPNAALVADGTVALVTGQHSVTFDTTPLSGSVVAGLVEKVLATSPGPTAGISMKRTVNTVTTASAAFKDIPIAVPVTAPDDAAVMKQTAPPTDYVLATPLTECKVSLEIISNV